MTEAKPLVKHGWMRALLFALTFLILVIFSNVATERLFASLLPDRQATTEVTDVQGMILLTRVSISLLVAVLAVYFFRKLIDQQNLVSLGLQIKNNVSNAAAGFFLGLVLLGVGTFLLLANKNLIWTGIHINPVQISLGFGIMVIVAFAEELVFRGYILNNLMLSVNKWMALVCSALLFALFHASNPGVNVLSLINVFIAGLLLGINYIFTKNLWFGILFHFAWNFYQGSILGFKVSGVPLKSVFENQLTGNQIITGGPFGFEGSVIAAILSVCSILFLGWIYKKRYEL